LSLEKIGYYLDSGAPNVMNQWWHRQPGDGRKEKGSEQNPPPHWGFSKLNENYLENYSLVSDTIVLSLNHGKVG
jgi:hypothetical protein